MGKKKDKSHKILKPRGPLLPPNKRHKSVKDYDRKREKCANPQWLCSCPEDLGQCDHCQEMKHGV